MTFFQLYAYATGVEDRKLKKGPIDELVRMIVGEDIPALQEVGRITVGELVRRF